jgi:hypothetical protein
MARRSFAPRFFDGESFASGASSAQLRAFSLYSSDLRKMSHSVDSTSSPRAGAP